MNNYEAIGRFTADPELKKTANDVSVVSFTLAIPSKFSKGEERKTNYIDCVAWRKTAELICKYFKKGSLIGITGELQTRNYEDKKGNNRKATECIIDDVTFCEAKKANTDIEPKQSEEHFDEVPYDEDLPF